MTAARTTCRRLCGSRQDMDEFMDNLGDMLENPSSTVVEKNSRGEDGWMHVDWKHHFQEWRKSTSALMSSWTESPVERVLIRNRLVYWKRDDQLKLAASISGNKARKMIALQDMQDFPDCVVSYGGPQSNAMVALAAIVHYQSQRNTDTTKKKRFVYYTKTLPKFLRDKPNGNLFRAQALGMELIELSPHEYANLFGGEWGGPTTPPPQLEPAPMPNKKSLWIPQGGACAGLALQGTWQLAWEIATFWTQKGRGRPLTVCIPGGTCSTAALVHSALQDILHNDNNTAQAIVDTTMDIRVVVIPCVGDGTYAQRQMMSLLEDSNNSSNRLPSILPPSPIETTRGRTYFRFGEPHADILATFQEMKERYGIVLDLLYGAPSWTILLRHLPLAPKYQATTTTTTKQPQSLFDPKAPLDGREIMYVHSGGVEGIVSQLNRYLYKGLVDVEQVQLPRR
ncbi:Inherit from COG: 1-aminocyclopropane-1-carboxylate deaminase [Seminavis robusta]|uniref:Inherit from COG: 1-aminocyclopropane-1-carboxylate deaminase n=1 Tax=Seminavis robusta TaxID=568900 RepID=A0A9N8DA33_9STRA|nr:Inherit from COG: 1-aminocyclopropane-1-carboxylate deaminase [Seminavis robusta]|eukprot:Sro55_g032310.1 Inherit from COG: 1-aminocyclopropane-1-carboxylate deaminase (453) ;mRNA; r:67341-68699